MPPPPISREASAREYEQNKINEHEYELFGEHGYPNYKKKIHKL